MAWNETDVDKAVYLNGSTDYLHVAPASSVNILGKMWVLSVAKGADTLWDWQTIIEVAAYRGIWLYGVYWDAGFCVGRSRRGVSPWIEHPFIIHVISMADGTELIFVNGVAFYQQTGASSTTLSSLTFGGETVVAPLKPFQGWIGRVQMGDIPSEIQNLINAGAWADLAKVLQKTPWLENPSHHWELGDSYNDQVGSWHLTAYGSPVQLTKTLWKKRTCDTVIEYPQATVLSAELDNKTLKAELDNPEITAEVRE